MNRKGRSCPTRSRLSTVEIDTPGAAELAACYADITGGQATFADRAWATVNGPGGRIDDLAATEARVLAAGATRYEFQPNTDHCIVLRRPPGTCSACPPGRCAGVMTWSWKLFLPRATVSSCRRSLEPAWNDRDPAAGVAALVDGGTDTDPNVPPAPAVLVAAGDVGTSAKQ